MTPGSCCRPSRHRIEQVWADPVFCQDLDRVFHVPTRKDIDPRLVLGAALFGVEDVPPKPAAMEQILRVHRGREAKVP